MTPQRQSAVLKAVAGKNPRQAGAAAIRAAVELVLPEEPGPKWSDPREEVYDYQRQSRVNARAQFLAIADAMEPPTDG